MPLFKPTNLKKTISFYNDLLAEKRTCLFWGKNRFDAFKAQKSISIKKHFVDPVSALIDADDVVLDLGCGAGIFLPFVSRFCKFLIGIDVSPACIEQGANVIQKFNLKNTHLVNATSENIPVPDDSFDKIIMVDLIHHLNNIEKTLAEVKRALKPDGLLIVYEPNKLNFLLFIFCLLDRNEWGLLGLGTKYIYRRLLGKYFSVMTIEYSGLLIGPDNKFNVAMADYLGKRSFKRFLGWLSPKILITLRHLQ